MGTAPAEDYAPIAEAWDFSSAKVVADLGGGGASLILTVLGLNPHLRGMRGCSQISLRGGRSSSRCELIAADLTQSVPAGADPIHAQTCTAQASGPSVKPSAFPRNR